jgi:adenosylmethionine-8-amino-7-oxononanoate aminotransferase
MSKHVCYRDTKKKYPTLVKGEGVYIWDGDGKQYIDAVGGASVVSVGHAIPEIIAAMNNQAEKISYGHPQLFDSPAQQDLAEAVANLAPEGLNRVYLVSGGSEATESALKFVRQYHVERGNHSKYKFIGVWQNYHGYTAGALSIGGRAQWRKLYDPYLLNFPHLHPAYCYRCPYGHEYPGCGIHCATELERVILHEGPEHIAAFMAEPIIGTSAVAVTPPPEYWPIIREICDKYDVLLVCDEVITGFGRTGSNFGVDHFDFIPDIITSGKGMASGYTPLGCCIIHDKIYEAVDKGSGLFAQGLTFAGNPLSCAVGLAVLKYIDAHDLIEASRVKGEYFLAALEKFADLPIVGAIRGKGLLIGIEFVPDKEKRTKFPADLGVAARIAAAAQEKGVYILDGFTGMIPQSIGEQIKISPPYTITMEQIDAVLDATYQAILEVQEQVL